MTGYQRNFMRKGTISIYPLRTYM